jgi:DNA-binding NarL/FixJ family response regulator
MTKFEVNDRVQVAVVALRSGLVQKRTSLT